MVIPRREPQDHKGLRSSAHVNSYSFPRAMRSTPQQPPWTGPNILTQRHGQLNKQIDRRGTQTRAHRRQGTLLRRPDHRAKTTLCRNTPRSTGPRAAPPQPPTTHRVRSTLLNPPTRCSTLSRCGRLRYESHHNHIHALPSPEDSNTSEFNPTGLRGALTIYACLIFLCTGRVPGQPGMVRPPAPRGRDATSCAQTHRNADTPTAYLAHHL